MDSLSILGRPGEKHPFQGALVQKLNMRASERAPANTFSADRKGSCLSSFFPFFDTCQLALADLHAFCDQTHTHTHTGIFHRDLGPKTESPLDPALPFLRVSSRLTQKANAHPHPSITPTE
ncbi:hypothetical protein BC828DRAFT_10228 [Blastocladiella britannica]|nr:hypothetical protein BC828DRAFT_10228 [Blastocladiella britannica]